MRRILLTLTAVIALTAVTAGTAAAAPSKSPAKQCAALAASDPELYGFIATKPGACQSTLASVGLEALAGGAFPSNAAAIGNCKTLEATAFQAYTPEDGRAYPYQFYWDLRAMIEGVPGLEGAREYYDSIADQLVARNRAGCVAVLRRVHGGLVNPFFEQLPPPPGP
jgi:hypothetical protein